MRSRDRLPTLVDIIISRKLVYERKILIHYRQKNPMKLLRLPISKKNSATLLKIINAIQEDEKNYSDSLTKFEKKSRQRLCKLSNQLAHPHWMTCPHKTRKQNHWTKNNKYSIVDCHTIQQFSMVDSHSSQSTNKLEVGKMFFVAHSRIWVDLKRVIIAENQVNGVKITSETYWKRFPFDRTYRPDRGIWKDFLYNAFKLTHFEDDIYSSKRMRGIIMQVFLQIVCIFFANWPVWPASSDKGKRP